MLRSYGAQAVSGPHGEQSLISPLASKLQRYLPRSLHCKSARNSSSHTSQLSILIFLQDEVQTQCQGLLGVHEGKPSETFEMSPRILQASSWSSAGHTKDARPGQIGKERRYSWGVGSISIVNCTRFSPIFTINCCSGWQDDPAGCWLHNDVSWQESSHFPDSLNNRH